MGAKQNLKRYLEVKGISPAYFYKITGLSNGFLNQGENISSNNIEIIISKFTDLNVLWLITNEGDMLKTSNSEKKNAYPNAYPNAYLLNKNREANGEANGEVFKKNAKADAKVNAKVSNLNRDKEGDILERNTSMVSEPVAQHERRSSSSQDNGFTELIRDLVDQLKEQSEEIGALRQENAALKHRLAQIAEDVGNASSVPA